MENYKSALGPGHKRRWNSMESIIYRMKNRREYSSSRGRMRGKANRTFRILLSLFYSHQTTGNRYPTAKRVSFSQCMTLFTVPSPYHSIPLSRNVIPLFARFSRFAERRIPPCDHHQVWQTNFSRFPLEQGPSGAAIAPSVRTAVKQICIFDEERTGKDAFV